MQNKVHLILLACLLPFRLRFKIHTLSDARTLSVGRLGLAALVAHYVAPVDAGSYAVAHRLQNYRDATVQGG